MRRIHLLFAPFCLVWVGATALGQPSPADNDALYSVAQPCDASRDPCARDLCPQSDKRFLGMLPSDREFDHFISPISNPFFFEDPRALTEVRGIFIANTLPATIDGGGANVWAAQARGRITENLSVIAPRIAYLDVLQADDEGAPQGFLSAPVGVKATLFRDAERQFLLSGGTTFFINGEESAISNFGDGDFHFFLTGGARLFERAHWLSGSGFRIPVNRQAGTQLWYWSNQWDYELRGGLHPLFGVNWFHWMSSAGGGFPTDLNALDLINLPNNDAAGQDVVTSVVGLKWKPGPHLEVGVGFEFPLTQRTDILHNRTYADLILRY